MYANSIVTMYVSSFFDFREITHTVMLLHLIRLNYRPSLRERAAKTMSRSIDVIDLDNLKLKRNTSGQRWSRFNYFDNTRNQMHASSNDSVVPVEVNVTKMMQMHVEDITDRPAHSGNSKATPTGLLNSERFEDQNQV